jgi:hypothetical protein
MHCDQSYGSGTRSLNVAPIDAVRPLGDGVRTEHLHLPKALPSVRLSCSTIALGTATLMHIG